MYKTLIFSVMTIFFVGCAGTTSKIKALDADAMFHGKPAKGLVLKVMTPQFWNYATPPSYEELASLPTGNYVLDGTDGTFVFFRAPSSVSYSLRMSHLAKDVTIRKGVGGIYIRKGSRSSMFSNVGAYLKVDGKAERVLEGYETFFDKEGKTWELLGK